jgi:hypothetical protein
LIHFILSHPPFFTIGNWKEPNDLKLKCSGSDVAPSNCANITLYIIPNDLQLSAMDV